MYARCGELEPARAVFDELTLRCVANAASYNTMVSGLARAGKSDEASALLEKGTVAGLRWNCSTLVLSWLAAAMWASASAYT